MEPTSAYTTHVKVGDVLNKAYTIKGLIARGGMGEVFLAGAGFDNRDRVALKVMLPHLAADTHIRELFIKEAETLTHLSHEYIVRYRASHVDDVTNLPYIVTSFIDGPSLKDKLGDLKAAPHELGQLMLKLVRGLEAAHAKGIVHRDISPDNILLENYGNAVNPLAHPRIIDFGIAKVAEQKTVIGSGFAGKLGFVAPEQLGEYGHDVGPWTDIYSLALVMLALARGAPVDMGSSFGEAMAKRKQPIDVSDAPRDLQPLLRKMLVADPALRVRSMTEVASALAPIDYKMTQIFLTSIQFPDQKPFALVDDEPGKPKKKGFSLSSGVVRAVAAGLLGGAFVSGLWFAFGSREQVDAAAVTRQFVADTPCSWLRIERADGNGVRLGGAVMSPDEFRGKLAEGIAGKPDAVDMTDVAPLNSTACPLLDALRPLRSDTPLATSDQVSYEMRLNAAPDKPGVIAATPKIHVVPKGHYAIYLVDTFGNLLTQRIDETNIADMEAAGLAKTSGDGIDINIVADTPGWAGAVFMTGDAAVKFDEQPEMRPADASWLGKLAPALKSGGWKVDSLWFQGVNNEPD